MIHLVVKHFTFQILMRYLLILILRIGHLMKHHHFTVVILPTVLSELDTLKVIGRNDILKDKAKKLIRKFKEYRRRGDILKGVPLANGNQICAIATEPNFKKALPWLDSNNNDDRIIALYFEVVKKHPNSGVVLVTADINMQTKIEFCWSDFY